MLNKLGVFKDFNDGSIKTVFETKDKEIIEMTLLFNKEKMDVVCVPTHNFCNLGCKMCHLCNSGINKKKAMKPVYTSDFLGCLAETVTKPDLSRRTAKEKLLISFMGVGEPLLNLKLVEEVFLNENYLKKELGYNDISYAISTMMPNDNILELASLADRLNMPIKLHFSLHSPIDKDRYNLIPGTKVSVEEALAYLLHYRDIVTKNMVIMNNYKLFHRTDEPIEIHYTLIKGVNDSEEQLEELKRLLSYYKIPIKFIRFNPINELEISDSEKHWVNELSKIPNLRVKTYSPPGREIGSSCGEFTKHYYLADIETEEELKEFEEWKRKHEIFERGREDYLNDNESLTTLAKLETIDSIPTEKVKMLGSNHSPVIK